MDRLEAAAWRDPLVGQAIVQDEAWPLTPEQAAAWARLEPLLDQSLTGAAPPPILIRGVTGSGKTELYLRAIARVLAAGRQAVVLVPEIALTPQSLRRFAARFPGRVGVWHSRLSAGERADTWRRAREGLLDVIVGSRSAVLAPLPRLGLLVVDECHAGSYKQGQSPRYHAIDVARERAVLYGATLILGSATPTVEQTWEVEAGRMLGLTLASRVDQGAGEGLPPVRVIDMRAELKAGNTGLFSEALSDALAATLAAGEQAILFLNRRGSASYVFCRDCGESMRCPHCRVPLTWHQGAARLICHHCNHRAISPSMCPNCASGRIRLEGSRRGCRHAGHVCGVRMAQAQGADVRPNRTVGNEQITVVPHNTTTGRLDEQHGPNTRGRVQLHLGQSPLRGPTSMRRAARNSDQKKEYP